MSVCGRLGLSLTFKFEFGEAESVQKLEVEEVEF